MKQLCLAYLDPTSGSIAYQVAISGLLAAGAAIRLYWGRIKNLFRPRPSDRKDRADDPASKPGL